MSAVEALFKRQEELFKSIGNAITNLNKKGKDNFTCTAVNVRINSLEKSWKEFHENHITLLKILASAEKEDEESYFKEDSYVTTKQRYLEALTHMLTIVDSLQEPAGTNQGTVSSQAPQTITLKTLPTINLPRFSGGYEKWPEFRDLFTPKIAINASFTNVDRMYYLKTNVEGEAAELIQNYHVEGDSFSRAWALFKDTYENMRLQVKAHLTKWHATKPASSESAEEIRRIANATNNLIEGMNNLKRTPICDDILVYFTVDRLDTNTRRAWESSLGAAKDPASYDNLRTFLNGRIIMLTATNPSKSGKDTQSSNGLSYNRDQRKSSNTFRAHHTETKSLLCPLCQGQHHILGCNAFKTKSVSERIAFVKAKSLCENCLGLHKTSTCKSTKNCFVCSGRHNTTLHRDATSSASSNLATTTGAHSVTFSRQSQPFHVLVSDKTSFAPALLPTALVDILSPDGTKHCVRALIDQGAQCSMITREVAKRLNLITKPAYVAVTGVGGVTSSYAQGRAMFDISSCHNPEIRIDVDALMLPCVTNYVPSHRRFGAEWNHLEGLLFADDYTDESRKIDLILGSDVHARILLGDIRKAADHNAMAPISQNTSLGWIVSGPTGNHLFNNVVTTSTHHAYISRPDHHVKFKIKD